MKVGDLVQNRRWEIKRKYSTGVVQAIGYHKKWKSRSEADCTNPDVWVVTPEGLRRWSSRDVEVINGPG